MNYIMISYCVDDNMSPYLFMLKSQYERECQVANIHDWEIIFDKAVIKEGQKWDDVIVNSIQSASHYIFLQTEGFRDSIYINTREIPLIQEEIKHNPKKKYFHAKLFQCADHDQLSDTQSLCLDNVPLLNMAVSEFKQSNIDVGMSAAIRSLALLIFSAINLPLIKKETEGEQLDFAAVYDIDRNPQKNAYCSKMRNSPQKMYFFPYFSCSADDPQKLCITLPKAALHCTLVEPHQAIIGYDINSPDLIFKSPEDDFQSFIESFNINLSEHLLKVLNQFNDVYAQLPSEESFFGRLNAIDQNIFHFHMNIEYFLYDSEEPFIRLKTNLEKFASLIESKLNAGKRIALFINFQRDGQSLEPTTEQIKKIITNSFPTNYFTYLGVLQKVRSIDVQPWIEERLGSAEIIKTPEYLQKVIPQDQLAMVNVIENIKTKAKELLKIKSK